VDHKEIVCEVVERIGARPSVARKSEGGWVEVVMYDFYTLCYAMYRERSFVA